MNHSTSKIVGLIAFMLGLLGLAVPAQAGGWALPMNSPRYARVLRVIGTSCSLLSDETAGSMLATAKLSGLEKRYTALVVQLQHHGTETQRQLDANMPRRLRVVARMICPLQK